MLDCSISFCRKRRLFSSQLQVCWRRLSAPAESRRRGNPLECLGSLNLLSFGIGRTRLSNQLYVASVDFKILWISRIWWSCCKYKGCRRIEGVLMNRCTLSCILHEGTARLCCIDTTIWNLLGLCSMCCAGVFKSQFGVWKFFFGSQIGCQIFTTHKGNDTHICIYIYLSIYMYIYLYIYISIYLYIYISMYHISIYLHIYISIHLYIYTSIYLNI